MEFLLFLVLVLILVLIFSLRKNVSSQLMVLQRKIDELSAEILKLRNADIAAKLEATQKRESKPVAEEAKTTQPSIIVPPQEMKKPEEEAAKPMEHKAPEIKKEPVKKPEVIIHSDIITSSSSPVNKPPGHTVVSPASRKPGFFERNPDLEKFIGENLANKIGIGILVLGIGFFVKYAIDQEWINEIGRVFIGIAAGGILLGVAHRMRKTFAAFSSVLVGGGIAVLYLTIAIAFHEYALLSQTASFIIMVIITAFTILLSLTYNRIELAVLALLGGFASPFMVSTGEGNYVVLFTYILILDTGMLVLAYYKKWNLVNIIAYVFTIILFASWLAVSFDSEKIPMIGGALVFATLFYLVFFFMNIINNIKERTSFRSVEITLLVSNTFLYYTAGMFILNNPHGYDFRGLFTALLGIFNFGFSYALYKNERVDRNLVFLLIGLVLTFLSLAAPVQLEGNYITLFWAAEAVLLLWLSQKSGIRLMKLASVIIMVLMVISLLMDWQQIYVDADYQVPLTVILNKGYITSMVALAAVIGTLYFLRFESEAYNLYAEPYKGILVVAGIIMLYSSQFLELQYQLYVYVNDFEARYVILGSYNMLALLALYLAHRKLVKSESFRELFVACSIVGVIAYLFVYHFNIILTRDSYLSGEASALGFMFHYLLVSLLVALMVLTLMDVQRRAQNSKRTRHIFAWFAVFFFVFIASAELDHTVLLTTYTDFESVGHTLTQNHKIGYPILWGISSFVLIAIGLKKKQKHLRIISLSLLLITLLKLFFVDLKGISEGGKIAAFISLGVLLLIVSFMYQRLKKLLLTDEPEGKVSSDP